MPPRVRPKVAKSHDGLRAGIGLRYHETNVAPRGAVRRRADAGPVRGLLGDSTSPASESFWQTVSGRTHSVWRTARLPDRGADRVRPRIDHPGSQYLSRGRFRTLKTPSFWRLFRLPNSVLQQPLRWCSMDRAFVDRLARTIDYSRLPRRLRCSAIQNAWACLSSSVAGTSVDGSGNWIFPSSFIV